MPIDLPAGSPPARVAFYNDPKVRSIAYQVVLCAVVGFLVYGAASNAIDNLERAHIASGFGFWNNTAGFDISQTLIEFTPRSLDLRPRLLGRAAQHAAGRRPRHRVRDHPRLHRRHRAAVEELAGGARLASGYVETIRNIPLLLQLLFWYNAVLKALPAIARQLCRFRAASFSTIAACSCRSRSSSRASALCWARSWSALSAAIAFCIWARKRQEQTGQQAPVVLGRAWRW